MAGQGGAEGESAERKGLGQVVWELFQSPLSLQVYSEWVLPPPSMGLAAMPSFQGHLCV